MTDRTVVFAGRIVEVGIERVRLPNGRQCELEIIRHPGGAATVAVDDHDRVCLVRQFRHAAGDWLWELPAGRLDPGESPRDAAARELGEETGVRATCWQVLGRVFSSPGVFTEVVHLFLARELEVASSARQPDEVIEPQWIAFERALEMASAGEIVDAKSIIGLFRAAARLRAR